MRNYFKVKFGFGVSDYVSVDELELQKAVYAMFSKKPVQLGSVFIQGDKIISITPHWHKYTGWNEFYEPKDADDWYQIKRDCPDLEPVIENTKNYVAQLMQSGRVSEIGKEQVSQIEQKDFLSGMVNALADSKKVS